ncbi:MAG TPA: hypothetical protein VFW31_01175 [Candidatus Angelobacter sp.]|nr:hypothetical protein [Candidatus Angelobacter sp.]
MKDSHPGLSTRLEDLTSELRELDRELKSDHSSPDKALLQAFRQTMDDVRLTAWTANELMNARESRQNPEPFLSFLASERMRRLSYMIKDLCADMDTQAFSWQSIGIQGLSDSVLMLQARITRLIARHRNGNAASSKQHGGQRCLTEPE